MVINYWSAGRSLKGNQYLIISVSADDLSLNTVGTVPTAQIFLQLFIHAESVKRPWRSYGMFQHVNGNHQIACINELNILHCFLTLWVGWASAQNTKWKLRSGEQLLTHWGRDKMDAISQTTFLSAFSWIKMFEFRLKFHWSLFLRVQLTLFHHWLR